MKRSAAQVIPHPFAVLTGHFVRRLLASDEEQGGGGLGVGLGTTLAILASPGVLASLFLLDKYSTLLQWFRGQRHFDPYRTSVSDEYFFIVLSMTVIGLLTVLRWNRLLPDRRDFQNLAALPLSAWSIFLANFFALIGLTILFAVVLNGISSFLFPLFVTMKDDTFAAFFHLAWAHITTVALASCFSFFAVFALAGLSMLLLPKRLFRTVSTWLRIVLVVGLLVEFFSNLFLQLVSSRVPMHPEYYIRLLPSFWFLSMYREAIGLGNASAAALAAQGTRFLLGMIAITIAAYALCYRRQFTRLAESSDALGASVHKHSIGVPQWLRRLLFRSEFEYGYFTFVMAVLARSERHLMFLGAYLGLGLVLTVDANPYSIPYFAAFFLITGLRGAFDLPSYPDANWMFRVAVNDPQPSPRDATHRFLVLTMLPCLLALSLLPLLNHHFYLIVFRHAVAVAGVSLVLIDASLLNFARIPFTCIMEFEIRQWVVRLISALLILAIAIPVLVFFERWAISTAGRLPFFLIAVAGVWYWIRRKRLEEKETNQALDFEQRAQPAHQLLHLT